MNGINKVILVGTLERRASVRARPGNQHVATFRLVTTDSWTDKHGAEHTRVEVHPIVAWGKLAKWCGQLQPGARCYVEGKLQFRPFEGKDGRVHSACEILAADVTLLAREDRRETPGDGPREDVAATEALL